MKMTHKKKTKMARKMRTQQEIKNRISIFQSEAWEKRKESIKEKVEKRNKKNK